MSSPIVALAEQVTTAINSLTLSQSVTAERAYVPPVDLEELDGLKVLVIPKSRESVPMTRGHDQDDIGIDVAVIKRVVSCGPDEVDALLNFVEEIRDGLRKRLDRGSWYRNATDPIYDVERLRTLRLFLSATTYFYRVIE